MYLYLDTCTLRLSIDPHFLCNYTLPSVSTCHPQLQHNLIQQPGEKCPTTPSPKPPGTVPAPRPRPSPLSQALIGPQRSAANTQPQRVSSPPRTTPQLVLFAHDDLQRCRRLFGRKANLHWPLAGKPGKVVCEAACRTSAGGRVSHCRVTPPLSCRVASPARPDCPCSYCCLLCYDLAAWGCVY